MRGVLLLVLALLTGCATRQGPGFDAQLPTTIQAIHAKPEQYRDKLVTIRGLVGDCWSRGGGCRLLQVAPGTLPNPDAPSISISFTNRSAALAPGADPDSAVVAGHLMNELYRFAEITLVGRYDGGCTLEPKPDPAKPGMREIPVCYDGFGSDLKVERVEAVHKRWPATAFPVEADPDDADADDALKPAPQAIAGEVTAAYVAAMRAAGAVVDADDLGTDRRVLLRSDSQEVASLCFCRTARCEGAWPSNRRHLFPAPANPYYCVDADRTGGTWHFWPGSW